MSTGTSRALERAIPPVVPEPSAVKSKIDYPALLAGCQGNDEPSLLTLYEMHRKLRYMIYRQLGSEEAAQEIVQETYLIVLTAIRNNRLRNPFGLNAFMRTVAQRQIAGRIEKIVKRRQDISLEDLDTAIPLAASEEPTPEEFTLDSNMWQVVESALAQLNEEERQILTRFYLLEQSPRQICRALHLTCTQFRLNKSRALALFGEQGKSFLAFGHFLKNVPQPKKKTLRRIARLNPPKKD
jgi:RNA polymerase sigma factor (sigma-70 family)